MSQTTRSKFSSAANSAAMSPRMPASPAQAIEDDLARQLPQGNCSYIMILPEVKGERCGCVNFSHKKSLPGAICECGHLACFHHRSSEITIDKSELDLLRSRIQQLEDQVGDADSRGCEAISRVSELESIVDARTDEMGQEIKRTYGNLNRAWRSIGELQARSSQVDESLAEMATNVRSVEKELERLNQRQCELDDAELILEERVTDVEDAIQLERHSSVKCDSPTRPDAALAVQAQHLSSDLACGSSGLVRESASRETMLPYRTMPSEVWAVHISLLPICSRPFPFERNTNAYNRCLSRGLHQMVAVDALTSRAFVTAVSRAFESILMGRAWIPLKAKLCDAGHLQGLPMLMPLDMVHVNPTNYTYEFLKEHCAVVDSRGCIDSLYIAMQPHNSISWHALKHSPVYLAGLEASWAYDPLLDANDPFISDDDVDESSRPGAGDLVSGVLPSLKRAASQISRAGSFGAATAAAHNKITCNGATARGSTAAQSALTISAIADMDRSRPAKVARTPCSVGSSRDKQSMSVESN